MKILTTLVCMPLLAAFAALPAQEKEDAQAPASQGKISDTDATKKDPAIRAIDAFIAKAKINTKKPGWRMSLAKPPKLPFSAGTEYFWHLETAVGALKIRYYPDTAPMHVSSGIYLARLGYYDGLNFHRIIPGFMAQGGCPTGTGSGTPGYRMAGEFQGGRAHSKPGILSMANSGPNTDGSQFFLTFAPQPGLNGSYTVWGEVVEGLDTLKELAKLGTRANNGMLQNGPKIVRSWIEVGAPTKTDEVQADAVGIVKVQEEQTDAAKSDVVKTDSVKADSVKADAPKPKPKKLKPGVIRELSEGK